MIYLLEMNKFEAVQELSGTVVVLKVRDQVPVKLALLFAIYIFCQIHVCTARHNNNLTVVLSQSNLTSCATRCININACAH